jgi:hypothetical protein
MSARPVLYVEDMIVNVRVREQLFMLLDVGLPDGRGDNLLRRLRALPGYKHMPAIAVTARPFLPQPDLNFGLLPSEGRA